MQIVINISGELFEKTYGDKLIIKEIVEILNAVVQGTPLPEHHGRLIDADVLRNNWFWSSKEKIEIDNAETIIPATKGVIE